MKKLSLLLLVSTAILADAPAVKTNLPAAKSSHFSVAVVDITGIIDPQDSTKSKAHEWKDSMENFQKQMEKEQKPLEALQQEIQKKYAELEVKKKEGKQPTSEDQAMVTAKLQEFETKRKKFGEDAEAKFLRIQKDFKDKIDAAVRSVAQKKDTDVVFYKDVVVYAKGSSDITLDVVAELNDKHAAEKRAKKMTAEAPKAK